MARRGGNIFNRGILRTIRGSMKRFVALAVICALGTAMLLGLTIACKDLRISADDFYDEQQLFDVRVVSTLGLDEDDLDALAQIEGVKAVEGGYTETVYAAVGSGSEKVDVKSISETGLNAPYVVEGRLPESDDEIAVSQGFLIDSGLSIGDTVSFHSESDEAAGEGDADADAADDDADSDDSDDSEDEIVFARGEYTIVASVLDPMNINASETSMSFRSSGGADYSFFVLESCATSEAYTAAYLVVDGAAGLLCYGDDYDELVGEVLDRVDAISEEREQVRTQAVRDEAEAEIDDAEAEALEELDDAQAEIDDAQAEIDEAQEELDEGAAELADGQAELEDSRAEAEEGLAEGQAQIDAGWLELVDGQVELAAQQAQVEDGLAQIDEGLSQLDAADEELAEARAQLEAAGEELVAQGLVDADAWDALAQAEDPAKAAALADDLNIQIAETQEGVDALADLAQTAAEAQASGDEAAAAQAAAALQAALASAPAALQDVAAADAASAAAALQAVSDQLAEALELAPALAEVVAGEAESAEARAELEEQRAQLVAALAQIDEGAAELASGEAELDDAQATLDAESADAASQLADAEQELADGEAELSDGQEELDEAQEELDEAQATLDEEREDALAEIEDARAQVDDIEDAVWYVQDRSSLASYSSVESDASSIESIGNVIPIVFFIVGALVSLTTMTRMVDEERGVVGIYKALGYGRGRILSKYALYALASVVVGVGLGYLLGFIAMPIFLFNIFDTMYALPGFSLHFDLPYALLSFGLFALCIVGATIFACQRSLRESPAALMRPKAPAAGARILLERIKPLWRRLSFLNKVTARNLFRYKRRFLMTVVGIAGTTALLVCGFGIKDTVVSLSDRQYGDDGVNQYDVMAVSSADDLEGLADDLAAQDEVADFVEVYLDNLTLKYGGESVTAQLIVVPEGESLEGYIALEAADGGGGGAGADSDAAVDLPADGALVTKNAAQVLGFSEGEVVTAQDSTLAEGDAQVVEVVATYLGNSVFMTQEAYEQAFGKDFEANCLLVNLNCSADEQVAFSEELADDSRLLSVVATQKLVDDFSSAFALINTVVYLVIGFAAALSFTVVFTLSNTNISERDREIATIKVLGFNRKEVHVYINKETIILTVIGILVGLPLGWALTNCLRWVLKMPSLYFDVYIQPLSYLIAALFAVAFTLIVNLMTNRTLDRLDMVEALKSPE